MKVGYALRCDHYRFAAATDLMAELHALHVALALIIDWANAAGIYAVSHTAAKPAVAAWVLHAAGRVKAGRTKCFTTSKATTNHCTRLAKR